MNLYDEKIIVAIEDAIQNMVEASGITADVFRLDGDRVIDALLSVLGDEYIFVAADQAKDTTRLNFLLEDSPNRLISHQQHWSEDGDLINEGQCVSEIYYISGWDHIYESISQTKRDAIDKAMLEAAKGGNE